MDKYINAAKGISDKINNSYILNPTKKTIVIVFCAVIAFVCAVSGIFVINEISKDNKTTTAEETSSNISAVVNSVREVPLTANLLFALEGDEKLDLLGVMRLSSADKSLKVSFISGETYCSFNNLKGTMNEHYKEGGIKQLVWAVGEYAGISIERYIVADYTSFKNILNRIGDMTVMLEHDVICGQDAASFIIEEGQQTLVPEMMTKYFGYLCENESAFSGEIAETMMKYGEELFCKDETAVESNFNAIISEFSTDISAQDYVTYKSAIKALACRETLSGIVVAESLEELK